MAKRKQSLNIDVKGLSTKQIINMDVNEINRMNYRTIRALASRLVSSTNKRIRSLREKAPMSQAYNSIKNEFSIKGLNRNEIRAKIGEMTDFLKLKTSTVKGWKEFRKGIETKIGGKLSELEDESKFWEVYRKIKESNHAIYQHLSSDEILKMTYEEALITGTNDDLFQTMDENLNTLYENLSGIGTAEDILWEDSEDDEYPF